MVAKALTWLLLFVALGSLNATFVQGECGAHALAEALRVQIRQHEIPQDPSELERYLYHLPADAKLDENSGQMVVNLSRIRDQLLPYLNAHGIHPDQISLEVEGGAKFGGRDIDVPMSVLSEAAATVTYKAGPINRQQYVSVVLKEHGREVHVTERALIEQEKFPKVDPQAYATYAEPGLTLPASLSAKTGMDPELVTLASQIQHENVVWSVSKTSKNTKLKEAVEKYGTDLEPRPIRNQNGTIIHWEVKNIRNGNVIGAAPGDIESAADAAFSTHRFEWDSQFVSQALASTDPEIALGTLKYWLNAQQSDGSVARELDWKGTPYHRADNVKFGKVTPNGEYFNPPLVGMAAQEILKWSPSEAPKILPRVIEFSEKHRQWLLDVHGKKDARGNLIGFDSSNLGSGEDNAPLPLDEGGFDALPKYNIKTNVPEGRDKRGLSVALLAQYKMMLDQEAEFHFRLGQFNEGNKAEKDAAAVGKLLQDRYWSEKHHWFVNLVPEGESDWKQIDPITLGSGFWPVKAGVASPAQISDMIHFNLENPEKFGGLPFLPSVPRDNAYFQERGPYWRGGGWPPLWSMVTSALYENGFRSYASELTQKHLAAMTVASKAYARGDSPSFLIKNVEKNTNPDQTIDEKIADVSSQIQKGTLHNPNPAGRGTVYEVYGVRRDQDGKAVPTFGLEVRSDDSLHNTRANFAGWGVLIPLETPHKVAGQNAVPAYVGPKEGTSQWIYNLLTRPQFAQYQVKEIPAFQELKQFVSAHPKATLPEFEKNLALTQTPAMTSQIKALTRGYVEISPTFDPGKKTELKNFIFDGRHYSLKIERLGQSVRLTVDSPKKIPIQFNRNWTGTGADSRGSDQSQDSSPILELGGDNPSVILKE